MPLITAPKMFSLILPRHSWWYHWHLHGRAARHSSQRARQALAASLQHPNCKRSSSSKPPWTRNQVGWSCLLQPLQQGVFTHDHLALPSSPSGWATGDAPFAGTPSSPPATRAVNLFCEYESWGGARAFLPVRSHQLPSFVIIAGSIFQMHRCGLSCSPITEKGGRIRLLKLLALREDPVDLCHPSWFCTVWTPPMPPSFGDPALQQLWCSCRNED